VKEKINRRLTLTKKDVEKAIQIRNRVDKSNKHLFSMISYCPVFQVLKREGFNPISVYYETALIKSEEEKNSIPARSNFLRLGKKAKEITTLQKWQWDYIVTPVRFTVKEL